VRCSTVDLVPLVVRPFFDLILRGRAEMHAWFDRVIMKIEVEEASEKTTVAYAMNIYTASVSVIDRMKLRNQF
jgi:hypothetical protein